MPNLPVRNMGGSGVITDIHPYDLPPNAISGGVNIRFENRKITRGPVFREVHEYAAGFEPSYLFSIPPVVEGNDQIIAVASNGSSILSLTGGSTVVDLTPTTPPVIATELPWTHTFLGSVAYLNHKDSVPLQKAVSDAKFLPLTAWPTNFRTRALRSYKDFLIALGVSKAGTEYPTMVKWSDIAQFGGAPASWDPTSTTNSAGENIINEMKTPIIDGLTLRDSFIIYCENEVWLMDYIGGNFLFRWRKLYDRAGIINSNCVVQVDGLHYVFDRHDIYVHDGASKKSICHGKVKDFIFDGIMQDKRHLCFVSHDPNLNEIHFNYPSGDAVVGFHNPTTGCNRAAVYNYLNETWSFYDLPNVTATANANIPLGISYDSLGTATYRDIGGSYRVSGDSQEQHVLFASRTDAGQGITKPRILGLDLLYGGRLVKPVCTEVLRPAFAERIGIDMDEEGAPLPSYKVIHTIYPQLGLQGDQAVTFQFGASDIVDQSPVWTGDLPFDPRVNSKVDTGRVAGRYLGWRLRYSGYGDFSFSGMDAKMTARGRRG